MSAFAAIKWARSAPVVRRADGRPDATAHHVLLVLATYAGKDGRARPSVATLAEDAVLALDTVEAALCRLVEAGLIEAGESFGGSGSVVWMLRTDRVRDESRASVLASRQERARRLTAERVRRYRERRNGAVDRNVTVPDTVTDDVVTVSDPVSNGVGDRDVTVSDPVSNGSRCVTSPGPEPRTANELPYRTANELPYREPREDAREDVEQLCERLASWVVRNGCKPPKITDTWRTAARLLLDLDGRELDKALALIDWCQRDDFWRANVQSMAKFRKQYDTLRLRANTEWERQRRPNGNAIHPTDANVALLLGSSTTLRAIPGGEP